MSQTRRLLQAYLDHHPIRLYVRTLLLVLSSRQMVLASPLMMASEPAPTELCRVVYHSLDVARLLAFKFTTGPQIATAARPLLLSNFCANTRDDTFFAGRLLGSGDGFSCRFPRAERVKEAVRGKVGHGLHTRRRQKSVQPDEGQLAMCLDERGILVVLTIAQAEAVQTREIMLSYRHTLLPHLRDDETVRPPYTVAQITEDAMQDAIVHIYDNASAETRAYYDQGSESTTRDKHTGPGHLQNWVIRWMLWHVFRYRDSRNRKSSCKQPYHNSTSSEIRTKEPVDAPESTAMISNEFSSNTLPPMLSIATAPNNIPAFSSHIDHHVHIPSPIAVGALPYDPVRDGS